MHGRANPLLPGALGLAAPNGSKGLRVDGVPSGNSTGCSVAVAGDLEGNAKPDLILGANGADPPAAMNAGSGFVACGDSPLVFHNGFE